MALSRIQSRIVGGVILLAFVMLLFWWYQKKTGKELDLVYDLSRLGRTDLVGLVVELKRDGLLYRRAEFFYPQGEGKAPNLQRHRLKIPDGTYTAHFALRFAKAASVMRESPFVVSGDAAVTIPVPPAH